MHVQRGLLQVEGCAGARDRLDLRLLRRFSRGRPATMARSEEHTSELQSRLHLVCRLLLEKKKKQPRATTLSASWLTRTTCLSRPRLRALLLSCKPPLTTCRFPLSRLCVSTSPLVAPGSI